MLITPNGENRKIEVSNYNQFGSYYGKDAWEIDNGFIKTMWEYISITDGSIIKTVEIPQALIPAVTINIPASTYNGSFDIAGVWKSSNETIISFNANGAVSPTMFGFESGPDGSWSISSKDDENGHYTLHISHLTGGAAVYTVRLLGKDEIELYEDSGDTFGGLYYYLVRQ
jgi:hypothetical protein